MYNSNTNLKKPARNPFVGSVSGGSTQEINTDANGMVSASNPRQSPFSPASERTFDMAQSQGMNQQQKAQAAASMQAKQQQMNSPLNATNALQQLKPSEQTRMARKLRNRGI